MLREADEACYHGTRAELKTGDLIEPGYASDYGTGKKASYIYLTATLDAAVSLRRRCG